MGRRGYCVELTDEKMIKKLNNFMKKNPNLRFKKEVIMILLEEGFKSFDNKSDSDLNLDFYEITTDIQTIDEYYEELNAREMKINEEVKRREIEVKRKEEARNKIKNTSTTLQNVLNKMNKKYKEKQKNNKEKPIVFENKGNNEEEWAKHEKELEIQQKLEEIKKDKTYKIQDRIYKLFKDFENEIYINSKNKKQDYKEKNYKTLLKYVNELKTLQIEYSDCVCDICKFHIDDFDCICKKNLSIHDIGCENMADKANGICESWRE